MGFNLWVIACTNCYWYYHILCYHGNNFIEKRSSKTDKKRYKTRLFSSNSFCLAKLTRTMNYEISISEMTPLSTLKNDFITRDQWWCNQLYCSIGDNLWHTCMLPNFVLIDFQTMEIRKRGGFHFPPYCVDF